MGTEKGVAKCSILVVRAGLQTATKPRSVGFDAYSLGIPVPTPGLTPVPRQRSPSVGPPGDQDLVSLQPGLRVEVRTGRQESGDSFVGPPALEAMGSSAEPSLAPAPHLLP